MDSNRDEAEKCIEIAERYIKEKNREKAEKFLHKAERLFPTQRAKDLLIQVKFIAEKPIETELKKRRQTSKVEDIKMTVEYTKEQLEVVEKINKCKDFYQILGVSKDASDSEIKKAYKKLALQIHPDKNKCPGAAEAFKAIGNAVAVLTDVEKRKHYDLCGFDDDKFTSSRGNQYTNPYGREFDADAADELFNMFFGGMGGGNVYVRRGGRWQRQTAASHETHHNHHREQHNSYTAFIQLLPILLAIVLSMASSFFVSDPPYSLQPSSKYPVPRVTQNLKIDYYVKENFHTEYQGSVRRLEISVEEEYLSNLRHACYREKNYKDSMLWRARSFNDKEMFQAAQKMSTPSCTRLQELRNYG